MNDRIFRLIQQFRYHFAPFIILGISIACLLGILILFCHLIFWGLVIGTVLWIIMQVRQYLCSQKTPVEQHQGRIIDAHHRESDHESK
jgi:hypothetical protein